MTSSTRFSNMDGWRAFALVLVILTHLLQFTSVREVWPPRLLFLGNYGVIGLDGFFFISGFVISAGLLSEFRRYGFISLRAFYVRRVLRIFPSLWIYLAVLSVLGLANIIDHHPLYSIYSAAFLCNLPQPIECGWYAGHTWTLAYEEQFYLLFPITVLASLRGRWLAWVVPVVIVCALAAAALTLKHRFEWAGVPRVASVMLAGVACAVHHERLSQWLRARSHWWFNLAVVASRSGASNSSTHRSESVCT